MQPLSVQGQRHKITVRQWAFCQMQSVMILLQSVIRRRQRKLILSPLVSRQTVQAFIPPLLVPQPKLPDRIVLPAVIMQKQPEAIQLLWVVARRLRSVALLHWVMVLLVPPIILMQQLKMRHSKTIAVRRPMSAMQLLHLPKQVRFL